MGASAGHREILTENNKLRDMVEKLRYHLVNQLAATGMSVSGGLSDEDLDGSLQSSLGKSFDPSLHSSLHTPLDTL